MSQVVDRARASEAGWEGRRGRLLRGEGGRGVVGRVLNPEPGAVRPLPLPRPQFPHRQNRWERFRRSGL